MSQTGRGDPPNDAVSMPDPTHNGAAGEALLEVFDPTGAFEITRLHAPRLADLNDKTICEISNSIWETHRTFPLIREELKKRFPRVRIVPYPEFVGTRPQCEDLEFVARMVKEKSCDAVIAGNAS